MNVTRIYKVVLAILTAITLSACIDGVTRELVTENVYTVGDYAIREKIYCEDAFPDAVYEREYAVKNGRFYQKIGSYSDESRTGITIPPEMVGEWLVLYSGAHLFLWQPDEEVRHFNTYQAEGWSEYSKQFQFGLNGHYDYEVTRFWEENGRWFIEYEAIYSREGTPSTLLFTSDDEGESYVVVEETNEE